MDALVAPADPRFEAIRQTLARAHAALTDTIARVSRVEDERDLQRRRGDRLHDERERLLLLLYGHPPCSVPDCHSTVGDIVWAVWPGEGPLCEAHHRQWTASQAFREHIETTLRDEPRRKRTVRSSAIFWAWVVEQYLPGSAEVGHG